MAVKRKYHFQTNPHTGKKVRVFEGDLPPFQGPPLAPSMEEVDSTTTTTTGPDPEGDKLVEVLNKADVGYPSSTYRKPQPVTETPPATQVHCFYHNDLDGRAAGAIVLMAMPWAMMHEVDYNYNPNDLYQTAPNSLLVFVDFTPKLEHFSEIARKGAREFIWIDHHESNVDLVQGEGFMQVPGLRTPEHSGAWLTWEYFYSQLPKPRALDLIDRWDTWTHDNDPEVLAFKAGIEGRDSVPGECTLWDELLASEDAATVGAMICQRGEIIMDARARYWSECMQQYSFLCRFRHQRYSRYSCVALNLPIAPSLAFGDAQADVMILLAFNGTQWKVSLYSNGNTVKCDEIAGHYGGGGRPGAAGFFTDELHMFTVDPGWDGKGSPAATSALTATMGRG